MILQPNKPLVTARALIIEDGKLLTFYRHRRDRVSGEILEYYSFPGGEIEPGETPEQAAIREAKEEMGIDIELIKKVAIQSVEGFVNHVYLARRIAGEPELMEDSEEVFFSHEDNTYEVQWVPVEKLNEANLLYYAAFLPVIRELAAGKVGDEPVQLTH